jgi:hypothetical protein
VLTSLNQQQTTIVFFFGDAKYAKEKLMASKAALFKLAPKNCGNRTPDTYHMELINSCIICALERPQG